MCSVYGGAMKLSSLRRNSPYYKKILRLRNCGSDFNKNEALLKKNELIEKRNTFVVNIDSEDPIINYKDEHDESRVNEANIFISNNPCRDTEDKSPTKQKKLENKVKKDKGALLTNTEKYGNAYF